MSRPDFQERFQNLITQEQLDQELFEVAKAKKTSQAIGNSTATIKVQDFKIESDIAGESVVNKKDFRIEENLEEAMAYLIEQRKANVENAFKHAVNEKSWTAQRNLRKYQLKNSPLVLAAFNNDLDNVKQLLETGCDVDQVGFDDNTALHIAAAQGNVEIVKVLLNAGANKNIVNKNKETSIKYAATCHSIHGSNDENGYYVDVDRAIAIHTIVNAGANEEDLSESNLFKDKKRDNLLIFAAQYKDIEVVKVLIGLGADINGKQFFAATHDVASKAEKPETKENSSVFSKLKLKVVKPKKVEESKPVPTETALSKAIEKNRPIEFLISLIELGADTKNVKVSETHPKEEEIKKLLKHAERVQIMNDILPGAISLNDKGEVIIASDISKINSKIKDSCLKILNNFTKNILPYKKSEEKTEVGINFENLQEALREFFWLIDPNNKKQSVDDVLREMENHGKELLADKESSNTVKIHIVTEEQKESSQVEREYQEYNSEEEADLLKALSATEESLEKEENVNLQIAITLSKESEQKDAENRKAIELEKQESQVTIHEVLTQHQAANPVPRSTSAQSLQDLAISSTDDSEVGRNY